MKNSTVQVKNKDQRHQIHLQPQNHSIKERQKQVENFNEEPNHEEIKKIGHSKEKTKHKIILNQENTEKDKNIVKLQVRKRIMEQFSKDDSKNQEQVKIWNQQRLEIEKRKEMTKQREQMINKEKEEQQRKRIQQFEDQVKQLKKQEIRKNLQSIEERKQKRSITLKQSNVSYNNLRPPIYVQYEQKFKQLQQIQAQQRLQKMKARKLLMSVNYEKLRQHQKKYNRQRKEKQQKEIIKFDKNQNQNLKQIEDHWNSLSNQDENQKLIEKQKRQRIKKFMQEVKSKGYLSQNNLHKLKNNNLSRQKNPQKKKKSKRKNQKKDEKFLGNNYLLELRQIKKNSKRKQNYSSNSAYLVEISKPSYHNYLEDLRKEKIIGNYKAKKKIETTRESLNSMRKKLSLQEDRILKRIVEMKGVKNYHQTISRQEQIDNIYSKIIHMKLAYAQSSINSQE